MKEYPLTPEEIRAIRLKERESDKRRVEEYACYNEELDLWNTTKLAELEREIYDRELMETLCKKST